MGLYSLHKNKQIIIVLDVVRSTDNLSNECIIISQHSTPVVNTSGKHHRAH